MSNDTTDDTQHHARNANLWGFALYYMLMMEAMTQGHEHQRADTVFKYVCVNAVRQNYMANKHTSILEQFVLLIERVRTVSQDPLQGLRFRFVSFSTGMMPCRCTFTNAISTFSAQRGTGFMGATAGSCVKRLDKAPHANQHHGRLMRPSSSFCGKVPCVTRRARPPIGACVVVC